MARRLLLGVAVVAALATTASVVVAAAASPPPMDFAEPPARPSAPLTVDGPLEGGTGAVMLHDPETDEPLLVDADAGGVRVRTLAGDEPVGEIECPALGASAGEPADVMAGPPSERIVPLGTGALAVVGVGGSTGVCGAADPAVVVVDLGTGSPTVVATAPLTHGPQAIVAHPGGQHVVVSLNELVDRRGPLTFIDLSDPSQPVAQPPLPLTNGVISDDLAFSADGTRLYATAASHAMVVDTGAVDEPEIIGRLADPLVRNFWRIDTVTVDDPLFGARELFLVRARVDGLACPIGMVHVYDITGELFWEPAMVIDVDVPDPLISMRATEPLVTCSEPVVRMRSANRSISIGFSDGRLPLAERIPVEGRRLLANVVSAGGFPYDITEEFRATLPRCTVLPEA